MTTQKKKHPYAEVLRWIANGEEVELTIFGKYWKCFSQHELLSYICDGAVPPEHFRLKRKTIKIGDVEVPEPMRVALEFGQEYYTVGVLCLSAEELIALTWDGDDIDKEWLETGLCYTSREDAWKVVQALQKLLKTD